MNNRSFIYIYDNKEYVVNVLTHAFQKNVYFRFKDGQFFVSGNKLMSDRQIAKWLSKYAPRLLKKVSKETEPSYSFKEHWLYLFGEKIDLDEKINENNIDKYLKKGLLNYLVESVRIYENKMGITKPYKIGVRKMKTRFGSNSLKTHSLSFQLDLVHFSKEIIDSVVVHELAHEFYRNHSKSFYDCVYKYCPNYWELKKKLRRRIYK